MLHLSGIAGSKSKFGSCSFIRLFAFRLDGSRRARHFLKDGGEGDHLRDLAGIPRDGVENHLSVLLLRRSAIFIFKGKAGRDAPSFRLWVMHHHQPQSRLHASLDAGSKPFIKSLHCFIQLSRQACEIGQGLEIAEEVLLDKGPSRRQDPWEKLSHLQNPVKPVIRCQLMDVTRRSWQKRRSKL